MGRLIDYRHFDGKAVVACSGGPDSMALLDFLIKKNKVDCVLNINHQTNQQFHVDCVNVIDNYLNKVNSDVPFFVRTIRIDKPKKQSNEEFWRHQRINFYKEMMIERNCKTVVTGHNLNDLVETWIMSSFNGGSKLMPRKTDLSVGCLFKPILHTPRENVLEWCKKYDIGFVIDPSNEDDNSLHDRVKIRRNLIPVALKIYPGLINMVRKQSLKVGD
jgi:tRNA(Ile)-lysidine synthase